MDTAGASASTLARGAGSSGQAAFGPCLVEEMSAASLVAALNAWGSARDRQLHALRLDLAATKAVVEISFDQASAGVSATLQNIIDGFRTEATMMQQQTGHEAQQSIARLQQVVTEARARFDEQDVRLAAGFSQLGERLQAADTWARDEPTRVAAMMQAAPAPQPAPTTPPGVGRLGSPGHAASAPAAGS